MSSVAPSTSGNTAGHTPKGSKWRATIINALIVAAVLVPFLLESLPEIVERYPLGSFGEILEDSGVLYQRLVTLSPRPLESRYVAILAINENSPLGGLLHDACGMRRYVTRLLPAIVKA